MEKFKFSEIKGLHIELTTKCNACCPMCSRNFKGKTREGLKIQEWSLTDCKKLIPKQFLRQLELISLCGVYGDPINAVDLKEIINYFYLCNTLLKIDLYTNGSLFNEEWWEDLALMTKDKNFNIIFGIDGSDEISELHRCNTSFEKVINNAKAYINKGGKAHWDFIVFKHNEHQVEKARELSKQLNFCSFQIKKTSRFLKRLYEFDNLLDSTILEYGKHPVYDINGNIKYILELPSTKKYRNSTEKSFFEKINQFGDVVKYLDQVEIDCQALKTNGIFISAGAEVFPCCTVYQQVCYGTVNKVKDDLELNEYKLYLKHNLSLVNQSLKDIYEGPFFQKIAESWKINKLVNGKCKSCCRTCGIDIDPHKAQHTIKR